MRCFCMISALVAMLSGVKDVVIVPDTSQMESAMCADEPWLLSACINPRHFYIRPRRVSGYSTYPENRIREIDGTAVILDGKFLYDPDASGWRPWENHYELADGVPVRITDEEEADCFYMKDSVVEKTSALIDMLMDDPERRIALCCSLGTGDMRFCTGFTRDSEKLNNMLYAAPGCVTKDMSTAFDKAMKYIDRREYDEKRNRSCAVVAVGNARFGEGRYEKTGASAAKEIAGTVPLYILLSDDAIPAFYRNCPIAVSAIAALRLKTYG